MKTSMKTTKSLLGILTITAALAVSVQAQTLFGPGTIIIGTNETILITTLNAGSDVPDDGAPNLLIDGVDVSHYDHNPYGAIPSPGFYAITGPHTITVTNFGFSGSTNPNDFFVSFQRITNSPIHTVFVNGISPSTNFINIPAGETIQLLPPLGNSSIPIMIQPQNSTNWFNWNPWNTSQGFPSASVTGAATIAVGSSQELNGGIALSYYFTGEVVQFPPSGLLNLSTPILEVNIQKSYDLTNWTPSATFHTDAEAKAFYRLQMLK